jgi:polysaccharide chain length determinant protein (PEP-CTERM system associated)
MDEIQEFKDLVFHYLRGIWKNRWIAIIVAWPIMLGGVFIVDQLKDRYAAETKVYIDSTSVLKPLLKGLTVDTNFDATVQLMVRKLLSRPNLERAIRLMDMDLDTSTPIEFEKLIEQVRDRVDISSRGRSNVYTISYSDTNRQRSQRMVQTLLDIFIEDTLGKSVNESDSAINFLDEQIEKYELLLQEAETRLEEFKRKNVGMMPKDGSNHYSQLQRVTAELENIEIARGEAINRRLQLLERLGEFTEMAIVEPPVTSSYDQKILNQETRLDDLLLLYTDAHPDVVNAKVVLESLKERRDEELANAKPPEQPTLSKNPVHQEIQILLTETQANISSLDSRRKSFQNKKQSLDKLIEIVPRIEADLQRLNRDYSIHKENYNELVSRREQAIISEDVESGTEQVKFRIIEPPFVPLKPDFPNRLLFDFGVLVLALGAGYGLSLLISLFQPVYYNPTDLRKFSGYTILGSVQKFDTPKVLSNRRRNLFLFALANLSLIAVLAVLAYLHMQGILIASTLQSWLF